MAVLPAREVAAPARRRGIAAGLISAAYDLLGILILLVCAPLFPFLLLTRHGRGLGERLGRVPAVARRLRRPVWVHAASVGEALAAEPLIRQLRLHRPDLPIVLSTTSLTGRETARTRLAVDAALLLPFDVRWIVDQAMRGIDPSCLIIVETEIWPALIGAAARRAVPCVLVSGRISERSATRYAWIRGLLRSVLSQVSCLAMQTETDAARIVALGAPAERVQVLGSLKFAREATAVTTAPTEAAALIEGRTVLIAASTHPGEEQLALDACVELWKDHPDLLLLIAPRRPERFAEVDKLLAGAGVIYERRSRLHGPVAPATQVLLLDTIGELPNVLPVARAVFVGGTFAPVGGHNVLEPAVFGKPVAFGPHTANVASAAAALLEGAAATRVHDAGELHAEWRRLLSQPAVAEQMGAHGRAVVAARAIVAERTFEVVQRFLPPVQSSTQ
jgi:3-deoxy-D-manno-octulosonic-acid transferase